MNWFSKTINLSAFFMMLILVSCNEEEIVAPIPENATNEKVSEIDLSLKVQNGMILLQIGNV